MDSPECSTIEQACNIHKNMKVAACLHFGGFQSSYALHVGWHERLGLLDRYGVNFDALVTTKCKEGLYPHQKNCLPNPDTNKRTFAERAQMFETYYKTELSKYDVVLTADMVYQRKGNFLAQNAAMREATNALPGTWFCHWIHSGWTDPDPNAQFPDNLRYVMPPRSFLVYLNGSELVDLARMYGTDPANCFAVYNPKDIRSFYAMDSIVWQISDLLDLPNKEVVQLFPFCTTRMDAKGIDGVIQVIAACKRAGKRVALILANANSKSRIDEIQNKKAYMNSLGLIEGVDYIWSSDINDHKPLPRKTIADLFKLTNLFTFTSWRETVGNVFQEALISGGIQLVLNGHLPCLREMAPKDAIFIDVTHKTRGIRDGEPGDLQVVNYNPAANNYFDEVAKVVIPRLHDLSNTWKFNLDTIWLSQFEPLLRRAYLASKDSDYSKVESLPMWPFEKKTPSALSVRALNETFGQDSIGAQVVKC
jgi:hypothetical protein